MRVVEGGTFSMGDADEATPVHSVTLSSFLIDTVEVTQEDYQGLMGENPAGWPGEGHPVEQVTWFDAALYCNARSKRDSLDTVYVYTGLVKESKGCTELKDLQILHDRSGYRLPTEAQWEYACRGGTTSRYYWGDSDNDSVTFKHAFFVDDGIWTTSPVGGKIPNPFGLYDMIGNVYEWCNDWFGDYADEAQTNPTGPEAGSTRCSRGGSWDYRLRSSAHRNSNGPNYRYDNFGLRAVLPASSVELSAVNRPRPRGVRGVVNRTLSCSPGQLEYNVRGRLLSPTSETRAHRGATPAVVVLGQDVRVIRYMVRGKGRGR
jgi:formylglycine-generating enzyme required for sulfatase activity